MTIGSNDFITKFGTQDEVTDGSNSTVTAGSYSVVGDLDATPAWTNDDDAISANFVLKAAFATAPSAGESIALYARPMNIQSANDAATPDTNHQDIYLGKFIVDAVTSTEYYPLSLVELPQFVTSQQLEFYIKNNTAQTLSANWQLWVTPTAEGPHA